jgi:lysophospholipase L1-like esterase
MPRIRLLSPRTLVAVVALLALLGAYARPSHATPAGSGIPASGLAPGTLQYRLAADGDLVITLDPQDPDVSVPLLAGYAEEAQNAHPLLSDTVHEMLDLAVVPVPNLPPGGTTGGPDFDGDLAVTPSGLGLQVTIPAAEVHTQAGWWTNILAAAAGVMVALLVRTLCVGFFPALTAACTVVSVFVGSMVRSLIVMAISDTMRDPLKWAEALVISLMLAGGAAAWEYGLKGWAQLELPKLLKALGNAIVNLSTRVLRSISAAVRRAGQFLMDVASNIAQAVRDVGQTSAAGKIMVVGDSMSEGYQGDWTWRYRLWQWLQESGTVADFVGPSKGTMAPPTPVAPQPPPMQGEPKHITPPSTSGGYAAGVSPVFDSDHFALWGRQAVQTKPLIREQVATYHPDLLLLAVGFNDMGWLYSSGADTLASVKGIVDEAQAANPDIEIAVANVPQRTHIGGRDDLPVNTDAFNRLLAVAAPSWSTPSSKVALVDWRGNYSCETGGCPAGYDGLHPNALGEYQIAQAFERTLHSAFGIGGEPDPVPASILPRPTPVPSGVKAASSPIGVTLTWDPVYGALGYTVRVRTVGSATWSQAGVSTNRYDTTWTVDGVQWEYQVRTDNGDTVHSAFSGTVSATAHPQTVGGPSTIVATATATGINVSWSAPTGPYTASIDRYSVLTFDDDLPGAIIQWVGIRGLSAHIDTLIPGHRYEVGVQVWNAAGGGVPNGGNAVTVG